MKLLNLNDCGIRLSKGLLWRGKKENKEELTRIIHASSMNNDDT